MDSNDNNNNADDADRNRSTMTTAKAKGLQLTTVDAQQSYLVCISVVALKRQCR
jgi:hypothetical protein